MWPEFTASTPSRTTLGPLRKGLAFLASRYTEHIIAGHVPIRVWSEPSETVEVIESSGRLTEIERDLPTGFVLDRLKEAVRLGQSLLVLRDESGEAPGKVIGFTVCEVGGGLYCLGHRFILSREWLLTHYSFVHPDYRGKRYAYELMKLQARFAHQRGISLFCGAVSARNAESLKAHLRSPHARIVATVRRSSLFGDRFVWITPANRVRDALRSVAREGGVTLGGASEIASTPARSNS
jgi:GNAT superfamily N-acetyltransferase